MISQRICISSKIIRPAIVSLLLLILTACGTVQAGHDFDLKVFETHVERGVSTQLQIRAWLGTPTGSGVNIDASGEKLDEWTYYFASGKPTDLSGAKIKMLQIRFDKQGIVRSYNWSNSDQ